MEIRNEDFFTGGVRLCSLERPACVTRASKPKGCRERLARAEGGGGRGHYTHEAKHRWRSRTLGADHPDSEAPEELLTSSCWKDGDGSVRRQIRRALSPSSTTSRHATACIPTTRPISPLPSNPQARGTGGNNLTAAGREGREPELARRDGTQGGPRSRQLENPRRGSTFHVSRRLADRRGGGGGRGERGGSPASRTGRRDARRDESTGAARGSGAFPQGCSTR